ncbi:MAG TPA: iron-containing redox enzyme family protein [Burkholderiales bacterium]|nr:iron-containing redox enzyme family protein [Burkholderiales bacterium]
MNASSVRQLSSHPRWVASMYEFVTPHWDNVVDGPWAESIVSGRLSVQQMQGWILQLYPFIYDFPKFLAEGLIKVEDDFARTFLIENIRIEKAHAEHWLWMGEGFGLDRQEMLALAEGETPLLRDVQSLTDWVWRVNTKGSLAEAVAATSFAIEGVAGALARKIATGFEAYGNRPGVNMNPKTYKWIREHSHYDDEHPQFALEIVKHYALTERMQRQVMLAAKRSLELLNLALMTSTNLTAPTTGRLREAA